jgi:hypothetical protein
VIQGTKVIPEKLDPLDQWDPQGHKENQVNLVSLMLSGKDTKRGYNVHFAMTLILIHYIT